MSQDLPPLIKEADADEMAHKMLKALNKEAWDSLAFVSFSFRDAHDYYWDKQNNIVLVSWKNNKVTLDLNSLEGGVIVDGARVEGDKAEKLRQKAWSFWCNDSFWFYAPFKVFDKGVKRSVVQMEDGNQGLMVSYESGGVTPGDKYMWILDENYLPTGWKMWVKIIPIKGVYTSWEKYVTLEGGAKVASFHKNGQLTLGITKIKSGDKPVDIGWDKEIVIIK